MMRFLTCDLSRVSACPLFFGSHWYHNIIHGQVRTSLLAPSWRSKQLVQSRVVSCRWLKTINMIKHGGGYLRQNQRSVGYCHFIFRLLFFPKYTEGEVDFLPFNSAHGLSTSCDDGFNASYKSPVYPSCTKLSPNADQCSFFPLHLLGARVRPSSPELLINSAFLIDNNEN